MIFEVNDAPPEEVRRSGYGNLRLRRGHINDIQRRSWEQIHCLAYSLLSRQVILQSQCISREPYAGNKDIYQVPSSEPVVAKTVNLYLQADMTVFCAGACPCVYGVLVFHRWESHDMAMGYEILIRTLGGHQPVQMAPEFALELF